MIEYFVGWHQPVKGPSGCGQFERCMISVNRLVSRRSAFPVRRWMLDSGAFTRITSAVGHLPVSEYVGEINRWASNGDLAAAVIQDWMCEPFVLKLTGLSVAEHQRRTIQSYDDIMGHAPKAYIMPVLQGFAPDDYLKILCNYGDRLQHGAWVGVGSVCKRNSSPKDIEAVLIAIKTRRPDLRLHGFGVKKTALESPIVWDLLYSADSQAHGLLGGSGANKYAGANCPKKALEYASKISSPCQMSIFAPAASPDRCDSTPDRAPPDSGKP